SRHAAWARSASAAARNHRRRRVTNRTANGVSAASPSPTMAISTADRGADVGRFWAAPLPPTTPTFGTAFLAPEAALGKVPGESVGEVACGARPAPPCRGGEDAGAYPVGWPASPADPVGVG